MIEDSPPFTAAVGRICFLGWVLGYELWVISYGLWVMGDV